jgi:DNA-binding GntR family transcriptional regulator
VHPGDVSIGTGLELPESLGSVAYRHLHEEIVNGRLPSGTVLSEAAVAKQLGISRTPVGEAVRQLVREGLLEQVPRYGTVVRQLSRTDILENYELREALESYAAAKAAARATPQQIDRINALCERTHQLADALGGAANPSATTELLRQLKVTDMAFHLAIVAAAGNARITEVVSMSRSISLVMVLRRPRPTVQFLAGVYEHHRRIADAIAAGNAEQASRFMLEHIQLSKQQSMETYDTDAQRHAGTLTMPPEVLEELASVEQTLAAKRKSNRTVE